MVSEGCTASVCSCTDFVVLRGAAPLRYGAVKEDLVDVRRACVAEEANVEEAIKTTVNHFGGIDIRTWLRGRVRCPLGRYEQVVFLLCAVVNNASAINTTKTLDTSMKKYDLMHQINNRGTFMTSKVTGAVRARRGRVCPFAPLCTRARSWPSPTC